MWKQIQRWWRRWRTPYGTRAAGLRRTPSRALRSRLKWTPQEIEVVRSSPKSPRTLARELHRTVQGVKSMQRKLHGSDMPPGTEGLK
jgi:hypothetical protein